MRSNLLDKMDNLSFERVGTQSELTYADDQLTANARNCATDVRQMLLEGVEDVQSP